MPDTNPNNQNYFVLEPTPVKLPWWKVKKNQLRAGGAFGVLVGVGLVGYYAYQTYSLTHIDAAKIEQAQVIITQASTDCASAKNPQACEDAARAAAAKVTGQATVCDSLKDDALANCVVAVARSTGNADACSLLSGDVATTCKDLATYTTAKISKNYGTCSNITDKKLVAGCQGDLLPVVIAANECAKYSIDQATCDYPAKLAAVVAAGKLSGCAQLGDAYKGGCEDVFSSTDQDGDGLSLAEESALGTFDTNADTDGDGYTDAQEVDSGHDPLK